MFDMDLFGGKKVSRTKHQASGTLVHGISLTNQYAFLYPRLHAIPLTSMEYIESMESMAFMESNESVGVQGVHGTQRIHGIHGMYGYPWNPWISKEPMDIHGYLFPEQSL